MAKMTLVNENFTPETAPARRRLIVLHGEKGGIGKSFCAALAGSAALNKGRRILIGETDGGVPDVAPRFADRENSDYFICPLDRSADSPGALTDLLSALEASIVEVDNPDVVIVNTPAGSSTVLDAYATVFEQVAADLSYDLTVGFMIDNTAAVLPRVRDSMSTGLLSIKSARRSVIYTGWLGAPPSFPFYQSDARAEALAAGVSENTFSPLVPASLLEIVRKTNAPFYELMKPTSNLKIVERAMLSRWLVSNAALIDWLVGE